MQNARKSGWTDERRAKHAQAIRRWQPWANATGPRTASGKARAALNAYKHGRRSITRKLLDESLAAQRECLRLAAVFTNMRKINATNELLAPIRARFYAADYIFHTRLYQAVQHERLCKKLAFLHPLGQIVNANDN